NPLRCTLAAMDDDRPAAEDSLLLFPAEPDRPARRRVPSGDGALSEFLSEPDSSKGPAPPLPDPGLPAPDAPAGLLRSGPAWCGGAAVVVCGLVVGTAIWSTREPAHGSLRGVSDQRPGGIPPSDRSSRPESPARSNARAMASARPIGSSTAPPDRAPVEREDVASGRVAAAVERHRAGTPGRDADAAAPVAPLAASALGTTALAGEALTAS